ncbi:hypothetical protein [Parazoarcus communis]|uniref:hypothetical protein n=1 Tax=Parazoarcus communis TaxID=41977 RepID=UPI001A9EEAFE|nr:hypothetical protein [Parazoarcus communis]
MLQIPCRPPGVIHGEQRKLRTLREELDPSDAAQIEAVIAEHAPLARRLYAAA